MGKIRQPLAEKILENSVSNHLPTAIKEWQTIAKIHNEIDNSIRCLCGTRGIKDWYELINAKNGKRLIHVGANCIEYFTAATDYLPAKEIKKLGRLKRIANQNQTPEFTKSNFPKPLLTYFLENDVFTERPENHFHAYNDYQRLKELIYKGGRNDVYTSVEFAELTDLWANYIKPFLLEEPHPQLHIQELGLSEKDYLKQIRILQAENARLHQALEKFSKQNDQKNKIKTNNNSKNRIADKSLEMPTGYEELQKLCRRRKNRRNLRLRDLTADILDYWRDRSVLTGQKYLLLKSALESQSHSLPLRQHQQIELLLETLTLYLRKRSSNSL